MFLPKSTKWGAPIFNGSPFKADSPKSGLTGVQGVSFQVLPKSVDQRKPGIGPSHGQL
jgi:hypothetical protein